MTARIGQPHRAPALRTGRVAVSAFEVALLPRSRCCAKSSRVSVSSRLGLALMVRSRRGLSVAAVTLAPGQRNLRATGAPEFDQPAPSPPTTPAPWKP